jgi:chromosome partitioning protein
MRRIAFSNAKGGVGKTTSCVNVGAGLARLGHKVLLVDLDSQGQVSVTLGVEPEAGLAEVVEKETKLQAALVEARENLWLLAGGKRLSGVKRLISRQDMRPELVLSEALMPLEDFDFVLLDTAPSWDVLNINCLFYADELAVPVSMEALALQGLVSFIGSVEDVRRYRPELTLRYVIPTFYDARVRKSEEILDQLRSHFGDAVTGSIRYNVRLSEAPAHGQDIFNYARRSSGAEDYAKLVERIVG